MTPFEKYIQSYTSLIPEGEWQKALLDSLNQTEEKLGNLSEKQGELKYQEGKWSIKEVLQHLIDAERIFVYRALRFSRKDSSPIAGWDETHYAENTNPGARLLSDILEEFHLTRKSTIAFFRSLQPSQLPLIGEANGNIISVETIGKLLVGHHLHHLSVLTERYIPLTKQQ